MVVFDLVEIFFPQSGSIVCRRKNNNDNKQFNHFISTPSKKRIRTITSDMLKKRLELREGINLI
jgi:hypothetical protein